MRTQREGVPRFGVSLPAPTVRAAYGHAWRQLRRHFLELFLVGLLWLLLSVPAWIFNIALNVQQDLGGIFLFALLALAYSLLVLNPVGYGAMYAYLRAARGDAPRASDLFEPFRRAYLPSVLAPILVSVLAALSAALGVAVGALLSPLAQAMDTSGRLLLTIAVAVLVVIPVVLVAVRLAFVPFLVVDERLGPVTAIRESWRRATGHAWTILGVGLLAIPVVLLGLLVLVVGVIPATMWVWLAFASLFAGITAHASPWPSAGARATELGTADDRR